MSARVSLEVFAEPSVILQEAWCEIWITASPRFQCLTVLHHTAHIYSLLMDTFSPMMLTANNIKLHLKGNMKTYSDFFKNNQNEFWVL
jgi:hypothetical protein